MRRHRLLGPALLVPLVVALVLAGRWPATGDPLPQARHVIVVAAPGLALRALRDGELRQVALGGGAVGAMSVRAQHTRPDAAEGYLALGSALNDSGPVVIALVLFYLAPLLAVCRIDPLADPPAPGHAAAPA